MTDAQRVTLMAKWWPAACRAQGWKVSDRAKRVEVLSEAVGRTINSANDLNNVEDVNRVKQHLGKLAGNLGFTMEEVAPNIERARRLRFVIRGKVKELAEAIGADGAEAYLAKLIADKFQQGSHGEHSRALTIDDLTAVRPPGFGINKKTGAKYPYPSQLDQVAMAISRAVTVHEKEEQPF